MEDYRTLDRATYKAIKNMDRETMQRFVTNVYMNGKNDSEAVSIDYDALRADLAKIKGIGENRLNEIMAVIDSHLSVSEKLEE